jgi:hypothetical protein
MMYSFVEFAFLNLESVDNITGLGRPEFSDELFVFGFAEVKFSNIVVFKLRMFLHLFRDTLSSEEPDTLDFKVGFFTKDSNHSESVLSEVIESLEETVHEVSGLIEDFSFTWILLVS